MNRFDLFRSSKEHRHFPNDTKSWVFILPTPSQIVSDIFRWCSLLSGNHTLTTIWPTRHIRVSSAIFPTRRIATARWALCCLRKCSSFSVFGWSMGSRIWLLNGHVWSLRWLLNRCGAYTTLDWLLNWQRSFGYRRTRHTFRNTGRCDFPHQDAAPS